MKNFCFAKPLKGGNYWENYLQTIYLINLEYITVKTVQLENEQKAWIDISLKKLYEWQVSTWKDVALH